MHIFASGANSRSTLGTPVDILYVKKSTDYIRVLFKNNVQLNGKKRSTKNENETRRILRLLFRFPLKDFIVLFNTIQSIAPDIFS